MRADQSPTHVPAPSASMSHRPARPVRVLIVDTATAFGGTLVVARNLLTHLDPRRVEGSLVSACKDGFVTPDFAGSAPVRLVGPRVDYVTLNRWKVRIHRQVRIAPLRRLLAIVAMVAEMIANVPYLFRLMALYRRLRVDVVHINNYTMEPMRAARLLRIPIVYHLHGFLSPQLDRSGRRNFRHVEAFVAISRAVANSAIRAGINRARIHEIPNFVDRHVEAPPPPLPEEPAIGIFGRVTDWKGQKEFLRAAIRVLDEFPTLRVYVVGDASDGDPQYFDECIEIARGSPYSDNFAFTGRVSDVATYYRKCTIVVHASTWPEPFGMVLIEAMAEARPVIASIHGAAPEIIQNG
ncbi:MAG: glycosyltransferase family 4 protein, partial [Acidobacteriota bacterium]|nr:glycosyltransferase family 4 protein [Acidobacteriota bacterium]